MDEAIDHVLISEDRIRERVEQLAGQVSADYAGRELVLIAVLKGAIVFCADLMRQLDLPVCLEFVGAASYGSRTTSSGEVKLLLDTCSDLRGRHVLVVEDIVDSGRTLAALVEALRAQQPASVKTCCLLDKPSRRVAPFKPDYVGFQIPDHFVVGYGLDFAEKGRNLPYIAVLDADTDE